MKKRTRTILFFVLLFIFISFAPIFILYLQGYRFDLENRKLTQTGGLFVKATPKQAEIYLDEKLSKKTDFFFGSALIENLLPKKHNVRIQKEGYFPWQKDLEVKEKEVTQAKSIILFPENPNFSFLSKGVENFWSLPNRRKIIFKEKEEDIWALKLYDLDKDLKSLLLKEDDISIKGVELLNLELSDDRKEVSLEVGTKEQLKYFTLEIDKTPPLLKETEEPLLPLKNIITYRVLNGDIYYLDDLGYLYRTDDSFSIKEKITGLPFPVKQETEYDLRVFSGFIFLKEGRILYLLNPGSKLFEKFSEGVKSLKISPDSKKLVYFSESEIRVLFLKEQVSQPSRKAGESIFLIRLSEEIKDVFWISSDYLIFSTRNTIKIVETDNRDRINIIDLAEFKNPQIFWNLIDKKLYLLSNENLFVSEKLIP